MTEAECGELSVERGVRVGWELRRGQSGERAEYGCVCETVPLMGTARAYRVS